MINITLTKEQHQKILEDTDSTKEILSNKELEAIASKLNDWINIPFISEAKEQVALVKIVKKVDRFIYNNLPNEIYELIKISSDGISPRESELIEERLAMIINRYINIPFLSEKKEQKALEFVLGIIISALVKDKSL